MYTNEVTYATCIKVYSNRRDYCISVTVRIKLRGESFKVILDYYPFDDRPRNYWLKLLTKMYSELKSTLAPVSTIKCSNQGCAGSYCLNHDCLKSTCRSPRCRHYAQSWETLEAKLKE